VEREEETDSRRRNGEETEAEAINIVLKAS
jgi:hypothetical protein